MNRPSRLATLAAFSAASAACASAPPAVEPAPRAVTAVAIAAPSSSPAALILAPPPPLPAVPHTPKVVSFELSLGYWCALTDEHAVACWRSADGTTSYVAELPPVDRMHAGFGFGCARAAADHVLYCWGDNDSGQLGTHAASVIDPAGNDEYRGAARPVLGPDGKPLVATDFLVGSSHACAMNDAGDVLCWGSSIDGEAGARPTQKNGRWVPVLTPRVVLRGATRVFGGDSTSCAVDRNEDLYCWGGQDGGYSGTGAAFTPKKIAVPGRVLAMTFGSGHSCLLADGIYCRGWNPGGQLGSAGTWQHPNDGTGAHDSDFRARFTRVPEFRGSYVGIAASRNETCAVTAEGALECIGTPDWHGARGIVVSIPEPTRPPRGAATSTPGSSSPSAPGPQGSSPAALDLVDPSFTDAAAVSAHMGRRCVLSRAGVVRCVGGAPYSHVNEPTPTALALPPH